jgi:DnaJ domain
MPCVCPNCAQQAEVLGLTQRGLSKAAIRKAYKTAAKKWHPDRFENNPSEQQQAEEHFKVIQAAYQSLSEHFDNPEQLPLEDLPPSAVGGTYATGEDQFPGQYASEFGDAPAAETAPTPTLFFGNLPGCFTSPNFNAAAHRIILSVRMEPSERPLAFLDFSHGLRKDGNPTQYILLTSYRIIVRNALNIVSFLWYTDLGEIGFIDRLTHGKPQLWQKIVEKLKLQPKYSLVIGRHGGSPFHAIEGEADDRVKKVIYNFLRQIQAQHRK